MSASQSAPFTIDFGDLQRRRELANFLRRKRDRVTRQEVGFRPRPRSRVPGLRREEVAELAGISSSWYTWLEQARSMHVSAETLGRIADALRMNRDEREQLYVLANVPQPREPHDIALPPDSIQPLLDRLDPWPAMLLCGRYDVLGWNRAAAALFGDFGRIPLVQRNVMWLIFMKPEFRRLFAEPERMERCLISHFRGHYHERLADSYWTSLVRTLERESVAFRTLWNEYDAVKPMPWRKVIDHPRAGRLHFDTLLLNLPPENDLVVTIYEPADAATASSIQALSRSERAS